MARTHTKRRRSRRRSRGLGAWPWIAGGGALLLLLTGSAKAAGEPTPEDQAARMSENLHGLLASKNYSTREVYRETGAPTEQIIDPTGKNRPIPQSTVEAFYGFMWDTNAILEKKDFDMTRWPEYLETYDSASAAIKALP